MPWCPRCDETFPEGPVCPRCSARLVARERGSTEDTLESVPGLKQIKVSRRYMRAFERMSAPRQSSTRAIALALVLLVFASGFLIGRMVDPPTSSPAIRQLPAAEPLSFDDVKGSVAYVLLRDSVATIALHDLFSGDVTPRMQITPAFDEPDRVATRIVSFGRSVAAVMSDGTESWVAFSPHRLPTHGWVPGVDVSWANETELYIRHADGGVIRWSATTDGDVTEEVGNADQLLQTSGGAVARHGRSLDPMNSHARLKLPMGSEVLSISPDAKHALLDAPKPVLWDGKAKTPVRVAAGSALGASFEASSERVAILMQEGNDLTLAVVDASGNAALKPIGTASGCSSTPVWDASGRWVYVATEDGMLHAVEASGGRIETIRTSATGCGLAWLDIT